MDAIYEDPNDQTLADACRLIDQLQLSGDSERIRELIRYAKAAVKNDAEVTA